MAEKTIEIKISELHRIVDHAERFKFLQQEEGKAREKLHKNPEALMFELGRLHVYRDQEIDSLSSFATKMKEQYYKKDIWRDEPEGEETPLEIKKWDEEIPKPHPNPKRKYIFSVSSKKFFPKKCEYSQSKDKWIEFITGNVIDPEGTNYYIEGEKPKEDEMHIKSKERKSK